MPKLNYGELTEHELLYLIGTFQAHVSMGTKMSWEEIEETATEAIEDYRAKENNNLTISPQT